MELVLKELERRGVVAFTTELITSGGTFLYASLVLSDTFIDYNCRSGEQLKLQF